MNLLNFLFFLSAQQQVKSKKSGHDSGNEKINEIILAIAEK